MNRKEYYDKLRKWEAEGYDVSELRQKWFPAKKRHVGRWLSIVTAIVIVVAVVVIWQWQTWLTRPPAPAPAPAPTLTFNPKIEEAIRSKISKSSGDITQSDLESVFELDISNREITDISGLEHCTSLNNLALSGNPITDLSPISNLTGLTMLSIFRCQVSDISPLSKLVNLEWLNMHHLQVKDISPLSNLTELDWLYLSYNPISNIHPLSNCKKLRTLNLSHMELSDISVLAELPNLYQLYLYGNSISDVYPLLENSGLGSGDSVYLYDNPLSYESMEVYIPRLRERGVKVHDNESPSVLTPPPPAPTPTPVPASAQSASVPAPIPAVVPANWEVNRLPYDVTAEGVVAGDTKGDGQIRIVVGSSYAGYLYVFGRQDGDYVEEWNTQVASTGLVVPTAIGDADNDGFPEFLAYSWQGLDRSNLRGDGKIYMYKWDGDEYKLVLSQDTPAKDFPYSGMPAVIGDLDGDGKNELVINTGKTSIYRYSSGLGKFESIWSGPEIASLQISMGDVDGDGRLEAIAVSPPGSQPELIIIGYEGNSFMIEATIQFPYALGAACAADLDNDGVDEIVTGVFNVRAPEYPIYIVEYKDGGYDVERIYTSTWGTFQIHAGDIDGDGVPEANILRNSSGSYFVDYIGSTYQVSEVLSIPGASVRGDMADVDGDGLAEALSTCDGIYITGIVKSNLSPGDTSTGGENRIAYIYLSNISYRDQFKSFLEVYGYIVDTIAMSSVYDTDFSKYALIIVGSDTCLKDNWHDAVSVAALQNSHKPVLGLQSGGSTLFYWFGLSINSGNVWHGPISSIKVVEPSHSIFKTPYPIDLSESNELKVVSFSNDTIAEYAPVLSPNVQLLARQIDDPDHYPLVKEGNNILWGFEAVPELMTEAGRSLFLNIVSYLSNLT